ncbi:hypothetical protein COO60DRAFT_1677209 [Scenedesmus sp. NREL 46B-D3]|nr:hypothetical protein COO60DRAFT_1677209 [Scenedesmus sp. NREL 46B-D3]
MDLQEVAKFCGEWRPKYLQGPLIPAGFAACVADSPDAPCLIAEGGSSMSFAQVDAAATQLARRLVARGVGKDRAVGILFDRQPAVVVSMVAVHKAGGCYVPLDPGFPADRLSIYLEDSESLALITEPGQAQLAMSLVAGQPLSPQIILYNDPTDSAAADASISLPDVHRLSEDDLAYIMFTSGSTGRPKGVMIPHRGVRDLVAFNVEKFGLGPDDVFCLNSTVCFDSYVTYVFAALVLGAKLVVPGPTAHLDPYGMAALIGTQRISCMEVVPALAAEYLGAFREAGDSIACLKYMLTGGEALNPKLAEEICATLPGLSGGGLFNSYGPTEVTVTTITGHIRAPFGRVPLGRPDHNVHTYVVLPATQPAGAAAEQDSAAAEADKQQPCKWRLAAVGEPGELWLSGPRLARGYRNRPEQTAAAYVPNPWFAASTAALCSSDPAAAALREHYRLAYRTSDLVVMGEDGQLEYLGRADRQIKINGVRMEISEVEAVLAGAAGVTHVAVKPWKDANGAYRLAGYVAPDTVDLAAAEAHCRSKLLPAMVPAKLGSMPVMPRLPNGKIDVKSLEEPQWGAVPGGGSGRGSGEIAAPETDMEELLAGMWSEELKLDRASLSTKSNFFAIGGNSLRAGLINSKIRHATGQDISGLLIYQHTTVAAMAAAIEAQYGRFELTDVVSRQGSFTPIKAGTNLQPGHGSNSGSGNAFTSFTEGPDSRMPSGRDWRGAGGAEEHADDAAGLQPFGSRPLPVWLATVLQIGGMVVLGQIAYVFMCAALEATYHYATLQPHILTVPFFAFAMTTFGMVSMLLFTVAFKWVMLGKQQPGVHAIWSWYYVRWWLVRSSYRFSVFWLFVLVRRTPVFVWYLRALGSKIGKNVSIDSANISDWDLVDIGDDTVIESDSFIDGCSFYAAKQPGGRGTMVSLILGVEVLGHVKVGRNVTLLPTSIVSHGTVVPDNYLLTPGTTSQRLPPGPAGAEAHAQVRSEHAMLPLPLSLLTIALLLAVMSSLWLAMVPSILISLKFAQQLVDMRFTSWDSLITASHTCWVGGAYSDPLGKQGETYQLCHLLWWALSIGLAMAPAFAFVAASAYMWVLVPLKWLLVPKMSDEKMKNGGPWLAWRRHFYKCLLAGPFQTIVWQYTSTEVFNAWLRALGSKIGRQCWLSEMFKCTEFELYEVEDTASVCSMVTVIGATSGMTARIKLGEACDVTNDCTLMAGTTVGRNACLGVFTYGAPGQSFEDYSITLGGFKLRSGGSSADIEAGLASGKFEDAASRLLPTWQYVIYNLLYIIGANTIFTLTSFMMTIPGSVLGFYAFFHYGYFLGAAFAPAVIIGSWVVFVAYLALLKKLVMADCGGMHPIFKSLGAGCWQTLCINCHIYADFNGFKGSLLYNWYLRAMGTSLGKDVFCLGGVVAEYEQVTIGDGAVIADGAFLLTHTVEARHVKILPIRIGKQCTVGALSAVLPNACMEDYSTLGEMSLVSPSCVL